MLKKVRHKKVKNPGPEDLALLCPPGRGLSMTLLYSTYLWSVGVMEYWKNRLKQIFVSYCKYYILSLSWF
jgi:hypothetical protein